MSSKKKWMILDAYSYQTLACVRSLGKRGIDFVLGGETKHDMSFYSKYCKQSFVYTRPTVSISRFVNDLNDNIRKFKPDLLFPTTEHSILACDLNRDVFNTSLLIPSRKIIQTVFNKRKVLDLSNSLGIVTPKSYYVDKLNFDDILPKIESFPVIIKAESSFVIKDDYIANTGGTSYIYNRDQLLKECRKGLEISSLIVQEFISGYGIGISGIFKEGRTLALFGHRRVREKDPKGGPSAVMESIDIDNKVGYAACKLMENMKYTGPAMIEFKVDHAVGATYLMEINGRFWGSVLFPVSIGVDLPFIWWKIANGLDVDESETSYVAGAKGRYILGDTKSLLLTLKGKPKGWQNSFPNRLSTLKDYIYLFFDRNTVNLLLRKDDIGPFYGRIISGFFQGVQ